MDSAAGQPAKALLIGLNYAGSPYALKGCLNDVQEWRDLLAPAGFAITTLQEAAATRSAILDGMTQLVTSLRPGELGFMAFSGHGTWIPDLDGDELDGRDEALVPWGEPGFEGENLIRDDELGAIFQQVPEGASVIWITDCCHSGTAWRLTSADSSLSGNRVRFLPPIHFLKTPRAYARASLLYGRSFVRGTEAPWPQVIHFSACRDHEYAADATIQGRPIGALTYYLTGAFRARRRQTYADIFRRLRRQLPSWEYPQTPQLMATKAMREKRSFY